MRIVVTGGSGFVGSYILDELTGRGIDVVCFDLHAPSQDVEFVQGDVRDRAKVFSVMGGANAVIHLAAAHHDFGISESTFQAVNVDGTRNVCDAMAREGVQQLCFYSTVALYGEHPQPPDEATSPRPVSSYGKTKLMAEDACRQWVTERHGNRCLVIRPTVIFGPGHFANMYALIRQIESGRFLRVGEMSNVKSLAFIRNIVAATLTLLLDRRQQDAFEVFNYADKPDLTSWEIVNAIFEALGRSPPKLRVPFAAARVLTLPFDMLIKLTGVNLPVSSARLAKLSQAETVFDSSRVHQIAAGPRTPLVDGISEMVHWYLSSGKAASPPDRRPPSWKAGSGEASELLALKRARL